MKKPFFLFFFCFFIAENSFAQFEPAWSLGGEIGGAKGISATSVSLLSTQYRGYLLWQNGIAPHWSLEFGISSAKIGSSGQGGYSDYTANLTPIDLRLRFAPLESERLQPYIFAGIGVFHYAISSTPEVSASIKQSGAAIFFPAGAGLSYAFDKQWAADCNAAITPTLSDALNPIPDKGTDAYWTFSIGITFTFGESNSPHDNGFDFGSRGNVIILRNVYFENGKAMIHPESEYELKRILKGLDDNPDIEIEFRSYTDNTPDFITSMGLTQERAAAMKAWFTSKGIASSRISVQGFGPHNPLVPNDTPENRATNERIELVRMK